MTEREIYLHFGRAAVLALVTALLFVTGVLWSEHDHTRQPPVRTVDVTMHRR